MVFCQIEKVSLLSEEREQIRDGFDLIEFPCSYAFKAMCRDTDKIDLVDHLSQCVFSVVAKNELLDVRSSSSRTGKFKSITLRVNVQDRVQLEAIYQAIAESPNVVMTL